MKKTLFILAIFAITIACKNENTKEDTSLETEPMAMETAELSYESFGEVITAEDVLSKAEMLEKFQSLKTGDTIDVKFTSEVIDVCQKKGCWMNLDLGEEPVMIRFKDYGFFMPKDIAGSDIIVEGKAYLEEMSVEAQRHYAEDANQSEEEIAAIVSPKETWTLKAHGVLIPEK